MGHLPPQQTLVNQSFQRYRGEDDMELPVRYLDRADPTIAWQVDPRLGDNQTKPPDHYSLA